MTTVLITGANRGLGLGMARSFLALPEHQVIACARAPEAATALQEMSRATQRLELQHLDVADHGSIDALAGRLAGRPIDILISNAGIFGKSDPATTGFADQRFGVSDFEADWVMPFRVNAMAPMKLAEALVENVAASEQKKIAVITSTVASISQAKGHMFGYAASKAAANMTARNLSMALRPRGIIVNPVHPGYAKTDMGGPSAHVEVADAVAGTVACILGMSLQTSGDFLSFDGSTLPW